MKKLIYLLSAMLVLSISAISCQDESEFKIVGAPYFNVAVGNDTVMTLDESKSYQLDLQPYAYSITANKANKILKSSAFIVRSNLQWRVVCADETANDWATVFPGNGEKEGSFIFKVKRNISQTQSREAHYNIQVDKGNGWETLGGMITLKQQASADFLETNVAMFEKEYAGGTCKLTVFSNVDWTYSLEPMDDFATPDVSWIVDTNKHVSTKQIDTLLMKVAENASGIRGANIVIKYKLAGADQTMKIPITQYGAKEVAVQGFPVDWQVGVGDANTAAFSGTFPSAGTIAQTAASTGAGTISFVELPENSNAAFARYVGGTGEPYVTGTWVGDYWEFTSASPIAAGSIVKIVFSTRVSGTGYKYWRLEYRDGDTWKTAGHHTGTTSYNGKDVNYTYAMASGGSVNTQVSDVFKYDNTTDAVDVRFVIVSNETCGGEFPTAPAGNTARLSNRSSDNLDVDPQISIVAAGSEELSSSNIVVKGVDNKLITFEGTPTASKTFTVASDHDYTITSNASWLTVTPNSGVAGLDSTKTVTVACAPSSLATLRVGQIEIKSGITKYDIQVVQSAAGGTLDPLISIVGGNTLKLDGNSGSFTAKVQSNVTFETKTDADWITVVASASAKSLVEVQEKSFTYSPNVTGAARVGHITFYNTANNLESILTVTQDPFTPEIKVTGATSVSYLGGVLDYSLASNIAYTISSDASWLTVSTTSGAVGTTELKVTAAANASAQRTGVIKMINTAYSYEQDITVTQNAVGVFFTEDFSWLQPFADGYADDSVGDNNASGKAPNAYTYDLASGFLTAFAAHGYVDLNPAPKVMYVQKYYLKFGKTGYNTGITLPANNFEGSTATDVNLSFDWCAQMTGSGNIDAVTVVVEVTGAGTCSDSGTSISNEFTTTQTKGHLAWQSATLKITGVTKDTRISVRPKNMTITSSVQNRWFIDNIKIEKAN